MGTGRRMQRGVVLEYSRRCPVDFTYIYYLMTVIKVDHKHRTQANISYFFLEWRQSQFFPDWPTENLFSSPPSLGKDFVEVAQMIRELFRKLSSLGGLIARDWGQRFGRGRVSKDL